MIFFNTEIKTELKSQYIPIEDIGPIQVLRTPEELDLAAEKLKILGIETMN